MKVWIFTTTYNQEYWIYSFLDHYERFADKIIVYDNESSDNTVNILKKCKKVILHKLDSDGKFDENTLIACRNNAWRAAIGNADWVIVIDPDELVWHSSIQDELHHNQEQGYTIVVPRGYEIIPDNDIDFSTPIIKQRLKGVINDWYTKPVIFNPNLIRGVQFYPGCHGGSFDGKIKCNGQVVQGGPSLVQYPGYPGTSATIATFIPQFKSSKIKLLHYRFLSTQVITDKWKEYKTRLSKNNIKNGWSVQYLYDPSKIIEQFENLRKYAENIDF